MSDDKPTTPPEEKPATEEKAPEIATTEKKPLTDEEKAAKIAEAKAKAAAKKAAAAEAEPKDPWEEKPVPPDHEDASNDADAVALGGEMGRSGARGRPLCGRSHPDRACRTHQ